MLLLPPQARLKEILQSMEPGDNLLVEAEPGAGKTFTLANSGVLNGKIALVAPTHVAKTNLETAFGNDNELSLYTFTSMAFAGFTLQEELKTGELDTKIRQAPPCQMDWDYIIIDEIQLTSKKFLKRILNNKAPQTKLIMMGDRAQAKPIMEGLSPIWDEGFQQDNAIDYFFMDCQARQSGLLLEFSRKNRDGRYFPDIQGETNTIYGTEAELKQNFLNFCKNNPDASVSYISYTNKDVDEMAILLRGTDYGNWKIGDRVRLISAPERRELNGTIVTLAKVSERKQKIVLNTRLNYHIVETTDGYVFNLLTLDMKPILGQLRDFCQTQGDYYAGIGNNQEATKWWKTRGALYADFDIGEDARVITALKSIGQTIDHVFLNTTNLKRYATKETICVAISRARLHLYTVATPNTPSSSKSDPEWIAHKGRCSEAGVPHMSQKRYLAHPDWEAGHIQYWLDHTKKL